MKSTFKTFDEVRAALENGTKLAYYFSGDDEYGSVQLDGGRLEVWVPYNGGEDVEEENQRIIDEHNDEYDEDPDAWGGEMAKAYGKRWGSWEDIPNDEFHYVPSDFKVRTPRMCVCDE